MSEENKHMDDAFRKASGETSAVYNSSFWKDAEAKLNDASLDDAFRAAALGAVASPSFVPSDGIEDMFMDSAFVDASSEVTANYDPSFFEQFKTKETTLKMDEAFQAAAASVVVDYAPQFWNDADKALQKEGLHYEYQSAYWNEAKRLLDKTDRKGFFLQWSAVAAILVTVSFLGGMLGMNVLPATAEGHLLADNNNSPSDRLAQLELNESTSTFNSDELNADGNPFADEAITNNNLVVNEAAQTGANQLTNESIAIIEDLTNTVSVNRGTENNLSNSLNLITSKSPLIKIENPSLSGYSLDDNDLALAIDLREDIEHVNFSISRMPTIPLLEINKGKDKPRGVHTISLLAAVGGGNQWSSSSVVPSQRASFGAQYLYSPTGILRNFDFGANITVNHVQQKGLLKNQQHVQYDINGGADRYFYILQYTDLFFTNFSFVMDYRIAQKHKFNATFGLDYLAAARSNMSYKNSAHSANINTVNNNWGVKDGLNQFDFRLGIGYEFQVSNRISITLDANTGFIDRTQNEFFKNDSKDVEGKVMLGLKYNIFRKI